MKRLLQTSILVLAISGTCWSVAVHAAPNKATTQAAHELFDSYWEEHLKDSPEYATMLGDNRYADQLTDLSPQAVARRKAYHLRLQKKIKTINPDGLDDEDAISLSIMKFRNDQDLALDKIFGDLPFSGSDSPFSLTQLDGPQFSLPQLLRATALKNTHDVEMLIKRLSKVSEHTDQQINQLRVGIKSGWMPAAVALIQVPAQFDAVLVTPIEKNPLYAPFSHLPDTVSKEDQARLQSSARQVLTESVLPAMKRLQQFAVTEYLPAARTSIAAIDLPGKMAYYQVRLSAYNTTLKTPQEIHQIGLDQVDKIEKAMLDVMHETGFKGSPEEFNQYMNSDPKFFFTDPELMLMTYRDIAKRIDAQLPGQFETLPRQPYGIRAMMPSEGDGPEHYTRGALDGSRAGYFEANVNNLKRRASWSMEDLVLHEAVPGHHLQIARASELTSLPKFRRAYGNSGFSEGWALYAESLGPSLGMYNSPETRYGYLSSQIFRACRLVIDTGIHAFGMTREEAIDYLVRHAAVTHDFAVAEVDRYIVWPGQATSYKLGQLEIIALRDQAQQALGAKFDIRKFNNQVVDHGALPLQTLNEVIQRWIEQQR